MPPCSQTLPPESSWENLVRQASARSNLFTRWTTFADNQGESISLREQLTSSGNGEAERFVRSQNPNLDDLVLRLFSVSEVSGIGVNGLTSTETAMAFEPL